MNLYFCNEMICGLALALLKYKCQFDSNLASIWHLAQQSLCFTKTRDNSLSIAQILLNLQILISCFGGTRTMHAVSSPC